MILQKKLNATLKVVAEYVPSGVSEDVGLRLMITQKGDHYLNSVVAIQMLDGKPCLILYDDAIERYGLKVEHDNVYPETW